MGLTKLYYDAKMMTESDKFLVINRTDIPNDFSGPFINQSTDVHKIPC